MEANMCNHVVTSVAEGGSKCFPISKIRQRLGWSKEDQLVPYPVLSTYFHTNLMLLKNRDFIELTFAYNVTIFDELATLAILGWITAIASTIRPFPGTIYQTIDSWLLGKTWYLPKWDAICSRTTIWAKWRRSQRRKLLKLLLLSLRHPYVSQTHSFQISFFALVLKCYQLWIPHGQKQYLAKINEPRIWSNNFTNT